ncbi:MAG: PAS domain S-box protein [Methanomicrobiaceae archaeon]|uniref:histidine kinase n=1 Tax=hydrocarbon metagenome TaxID=938273 RepID=A0A0W8FGQ5_9ZZZZ|nr:PAS domain S-box protein [Methanomicrobiaceae archaeon]MDD5418478.1 PAS domain S-box protein [Methanomicrobiaceae archaeon]
MTSPDNATGSEGIQRRRRLLAAAPVFLLTLVFAVQFFVDIPIDVIAPFQAALNILLNVGFIVLAALVAWGVVKIGRLQLVWMGSGILVLGLAILTANLVGSPISLNTGIQIQNIGALLAGSLHFIGALMAVFSIGLLRPDRRQRTIALAAGYGGGIAAVVLVVLLSAASALPVFFIPGEGGTPIRQAVITLAAVLFAASALLLFVQYSRSRSSFLYMYSLALTFLSLGQLAYLFAVTSGDIMSWIGRVGQWGASIYFLIALFLLFHLSRSRLGDVHHLLDGIFPPSSEGYRLLIEASPDAIIGLDAEGRVLVWNSAAEKILGYSSREAMGRPLGDLLGIRLSWRDSGASANPGTQESEELLLRRQDGREVWLGISVAHGAVRGHPVATVNIRDITRRKRAELSLRESEERYRQLHRQLEIANRETSLYLDILTHDIGNTENVSNLYDDILVETVEGEALGYAEKLRRSIKKSIEILDTVSKIRRIHQASPDLRPVDLDAAIRDGVREFPDRPVYYDGIPLWVWADDLLGVVTSNLIGNAVRHGGPDVRIAVRVEGLEGEVLVSVEDTGPGIPAAGKLEVFRRYEQQKRGVGEGLGLYLVQILIERYGGRVWADDRVPGRPEEGAAFRFTLRQADQDGED